MATWKETDGFTDAQVAVLNNLSDDRYGKVDTPIVDNGEIYNWQNSVFRTQLTQLDVEILREMVYITKYKTFNNNHDFRRDLTITYDSNSDYTGKILDRRLEI